MGMSEDVQLRDVQETDLEVFYQQQLDPIAAERARFPSRDRERFMTHWHTRVLGNPTGFYQTVAVDGAVAGNIVAWWYEPEEDKRYTGYWFGREFWGRGIGSRAMMLFLEREKTRPLYADPHQGNVGSVRLLEKCGFERVGIVHEEFVLLVLK